MSARPTSDRMLTAMVAELVDGHRCHTVVLYGSRARGAETATSDYDLLGLWDQPETLRIAHDRHGGYLDAFIHPVTILEGPVDEHLKLRGGAVLVQRDGVGDRLLAQVEARFQAGPVLWTADVREATRSWATKMLARIAQDDVEGRYRRAMLLYQLLEDYFSARGLWYTGPKAAVAWLAEHDPVAHGALAAALEPGASHASLTAWVQSVWRGVG